MTNDAPIHLKLPYAKAIHVSNSEVPGVSGVVFETVDEQFVGALLPRHLLSATAGRLIEFAQRIGEIQPADTTPSEAVPILAQMSIATGRSPSEVLYFFRLGPMDLCFAVDTTQAVGLAKLLLSKAKAGGPNKPQ